MKQKFVLRQGVHKDAPRFKPNILKNLQIDWLDKDIFELDEPDNYLYKHRELNAYFYQKFAEKSSGNMAVQLATTNYRYYLMDQQTASERFEDYDLKELARKGNIALLDQVKQFPAYRSDYNLKKGKEYETERRRKIKENSDEDRYRQREKGIDPPEGRYLAIDVTFKPTYSDIEVVREEEHPMADILTLDRWKKGTNVFIPHHTVYDYEQCSRQVLSMCIMENQKIPDYKDGYKREGLHEVVEFLLDPIIERISVKGVAGDGDYFNKKALKYFQENELDYVILANTTDYISDIIDEHDLKETLDDGEGFEVEDGLTMGSGDGIVENRLVIVNRNEKMVPLILAPYSDLTPEQALLVYEERFGIETSYREIYKYLPRTTSKTPQYRLVAYFMTCWFFNLLLNYYQVVVVYSSDPETWDVSLEFIKNQADRLFADLLREVVASE